MQKTQKTIKRIVSLIIWLTLAGVCLFNKSTLSVEKIVTFTPSNIFTAIPIILLLFGVKSIVMFVYYGILFAASGIIFPLHAALIINTAGTFIMCIIPYIIGRHEGKRIIDSLSEKYSNVKLLKTSEYKNEFLTVFFTRFIGLIPSDLVGMYFGAKSISPKSYFAGSVLGFLPSIILYTVIGTSIDDITSPEFIISTAIQGFLVLFSAVFLILLKRKEKKAENKTQNEL